MQLYNLTKEIEFIRNKNITEFIKTQSITEKRYFGDKKEFIKYLYRYDLSEFLGLGKRFKCIFHDEDKASATIRYYRGEAYLYKCFGQCEKEKCYNIIGIVMKICEITYTESRGKGLPSVYKHFCGRRAEKDRTNYSHPYKGN